MNISLTTAKIFWTFVFTHLLLWTLIPYLTSPNAPLDVIEGYAWGRQWLIGTYKHPPMQAWWLEILAVLTNRAPWASFLASQIAVVIAFWAVWRTGTRLTDERKALFGVLLLEGVVYYNFTTPEFNPNVLQLPFWALMAWSFHRAVTENKGWDWVLLGVWAAGGMYTKYTSLISIALLVLLLILHPVARQRLKQSGPYLALAVGLVLFAPHMDWLITNHFLPFTYAHSRMDPAMHWHDHVFHPWQFFLSQTASVLGLLLMGFALAGRKFASPNFNFRTMSFDQAFLHMIALCPFLVVLLLSFFSGIKPRDMWGASLWNFAGLWVVVNLVSTPNAKNIKQFSIKFMVLGGAFLLACVIANVYSPYFTHKAMRVDFPGKSMATTIVERWHQQYQTNPAYIIGDTWLAGNVAFYTPADSASLRPQVLINGDYTISPWIKPEDIATQGGILVWCGLHCASQKDAESIPAYLKDRFPEAVLQQPLTFLRQTGANLPPAIIGWAILSPKR